VIAIAPLKWEFELTNKFLSFQKPSIQSAENLKLFISMMNFSSSQEAILYLIKEVRKLSVYVSLCYIILFVLITFFKESLKQIFPIKSKLLNFIISLHLILFFLVIGWWLFYLDYYLHNYSGKTNEEIRNGINIQWSSNFYSFVQQCQRLITEDENIVLLIKSFSPQLKLPKYHIIFNHFLYPRKVYIHFSDSSDQISLYQGIWQQKYANAIITLDTINYNLLQQKNIKWIIRYHEDLIFDPKKAEIIKVDDLLK